MRTGHLLLALLLGLAGCSAGTSRDASELPGTEEPAPQSPFAASPQTVECRSYLVWAEAPYDEVRQLVPPAYQLRSSVADVALARVGLWALACTAIILDNATVIRPAGLAQSVAAVDVNETLQGEADEHVYALEIFASNSTLVELFSALGFRASLAEVAVAGDGTSTEVRISVGGSRWYTASGTNGAGTDARSSSVARTHQAGDDVLWFDHDQTYVHPSAPGDATLRAERGVLHEFSAGNQGLLAGLGHGGTSHGVIRFGRL